MSENYMKDKNVKQYYDFWVKGPTLFEHSLDRERFYKFVKSVVNWAGGKEVQKKVDHQYLKLHLYDDFHDKYSEEYYDNLQRDIMVKVESLLEYEDTDY